MSENAEKLATALRLPGIDIARGLAVIAMIGYHFTWDLWAFRLVQVDLLHNPAWLLARTVICGGFLFIAGLCAGLPVSLPWAAVWRRFQRVAGAAVLVSIATWNVFPESWIFFGVLHHLAVAGVLAWGLRLVPAPLLAGLGVLVAGVGLSDPVGFDVLNQPWLRWVGLGSVAPDSNDYVPLIPWFGPFLLGLALGRARAGRVADAIPFESPVRGLAGLGLAWLGRHSLTIYLAHQPLLYGAVWAFVTVVALSVAGGGGGVQDPAESGFLRSCAESCVGSGASLTVCQSTCRCSMESLQREGLWVPLLQSRLTPSQMGRVEALIAACPRPGTGP